MKVEKAVIPAAGLGTRFLPATKAQPKEMLPVVDKPAIQYVVEEAVSAGIRDILIITASSKRTLEDHFDRSFELEQRLEASGKLDELKQVREISEMADIFYVRQKEPAGLGAAVALAEPYVGSGPFAVLLGDDIITSGDALTRMVSIYERYGRSVLAAREVPRSEIHLYGCIEPEFVEDNLARVVRLVEKPSAEEAPSTLASIGRYVLTPEIFDALRETPPDRGGEVQLADAINSLAQLQTVYAYAFEGTRYDIGKKIEYLRATVEIAIEREDVGPEFRQILADLVQRKRLV
jgi:UTP--glucose-1-phosphate uridylyltransferase